MPFFYIKTLIKIITYFLFLNLFILETESKREYVHGGGQKERWREPQADSPLRMEPKVGLETTFLRT